jgi:hypothetical protein
LALKVALTNFLVAPPQEQHAPATLLALTFVQAAVQAPVVVVASSFRP